VIEPRPRIAGHLQANRKIDASARRDPYPAGQEPKAARMENSPPLLRRAWAKTRQVVLTTAEQASPLARRPYDLRHA
jgi:hypothetical protein